MTLKAYLSLMFFLTTICWLTFYFVIWTINPETTNWIGFMLFYTSLFLSLSGLISILGFMLRFIILKHELAFRSVRVAFRQSFLFSFLIITCLFLLSHQLLNWLNLFLLIIGLSMLEFFWISYSSQK